MTKALRQTMVAALALALTMTTACTDQGNKSAQNQDNRDQNRNILSLGVSPSPAGQAGRPDQAGGNFSAASGGNAAELAADSDGSLPVRNMGGDDYVPAGKLTELIGYRTVWDSNNRVMKFGNNDAAFEINLDSTQARREDDTLNLAKAPQMIDGIPHIPVSAIADLLSDEVAFTKQGNNLVITPTADPVDLQVDQDGELPQGDAMNFGEDPADPYKDFHVGEETAAPSSASADDDGAVAAAALRNIDITGLISKARNYLGVRYDFGASPYSRSGRFDCSSFTQYLFGKYGVDLPRTARAQAKRGNSVSRKSLRRGDLLFFYVPGRFKTNKTVGHVGIYIGDYKMIHSSPLPKDGVQITNINKAYWKRTFLHGKRISR